MLKQFVKTTPLYGLIREVRGRNEYRRWAREGRPTPPPHFAKRAIIGEYAAHCGARVFVETGTYLGDMVDAMRERFDRVYSIELSEELAHRAKVRFAGDRRVEILQGDSASVLPGLLDRIDEPCLFWLDGHFSGGLTALGDKISPIFEELETIFAHAVREHTILIDDARLFTESEGYPALEQVLALARARSSEFVATVEDDIIRICPPGGGVPSPRRRTGRIA